MVRENVSCVFISCKFRKENVHYNILSQAELTHFSVLSVWNATLPIILFMIDEAK